MLIIFDVDGTLVGGEVHDWACFDRAIASVLGFSPTSEFFESLAEITAQAIAEAAILRAGCELGIGLEQRICEEYLRGLKEVHAADPLAFPAREGALALLAHLRSMPGVSVAIATGDWYSTICFKLAAAGIDVSQYPMTTSSDSSRRSEIIRLAAQGANRNLRDAVYVGDGVWDLRACGEIDIAFIGTGVRPHLLREAGARSIIEVFEVASFLSVLQDAMRPGMVK
jgi:phosphoglycolate phosphatase-like HAD superfamily hydrolase